ncbi:DUF2254 domain-containing protein [Gracilibacillus marinus]|uniref:DUF2254 domain-containing protein n=1 Tax=Gracilibacillus marinus TaxID=630535 RepID=A0ABV8VYU6_9BACI
MLKHFWYRIQQQLWVIPAIYVLVTTILILFIQLIDHQVLAKWSDFFPSVILTSPDLAKDTLGVIAGALLTMTTITFSTTMVVLTTYSSQFSPRTLQNFLTDKKTLHVLGVFIAGFYYSVVSLVLVRLNTDAEVLLSATVGVLISLLCLGFFAFFIQHAGTFMQVSNLIRNLVNEGNDRVEKLESFYKKECVVTSPSTVDTYSYKHELFFPSHGYVQIIDTDLLFQQAKKIDARIAIQVEIGVYVTPKDCALLVHTNEEEIDETALLHAITIGNERNEKEDSMFTIQKLEEIALRAISPAVNDPHTAIDCLEQIGRVLGLLIKHDSEYAAYHEDGKQRVVLKQRSIQDMLYTSYNKIVAYASDISVILAVLRSYKTVVKYNHGKVKKEMLVMLDYVDHRMKDLSMHTLDDRYYERLVHEIREELDKE